jgi:hypothetical protein
MPKFIIERDVPGAGAMTPEETAAAARKSSLVIRELGGEITWITSYVTDNKVYCVFVAPDEDLIAEHAQCSGQGFKLISRIRNSIDPSTGD